MIGKARKIQEERRQQLHDTSEESEDDDDEYEGDYDNDNDEPYN